MKLVIRTEKETITSLELVDKINELRSLEKNKSNLGHNDLLKIIRDEFEEEISLGEISQSTYINERGRSYPMFVLTLDQVRQMLVRESKFVRKKVFEYIKYLENQNFLLKQAMWNKQNTEWLETRKQGKLTRRNETDVIASLILYATEQGSKNANKLYVVYSKLVNNLVGIESGMRDIVSIETLFNISKLEDLFQSIMIDCMENSVYYKEIYKRCKEYGTQMMKYLNKDIKALNNKK